MILYFQRLRTGLSKLGTFLFLFNNGRQKLFYEGQFYSIIYMITFYNNTNPLGVIVFCESVTLLLKIIIVVCAKDRLVAVNTDHPCQSDNHR